MMFRAVVLIGVLLMSAARPATAQQPRTVFLILMENQNWSFIKGNPGAWYINHSLLPMASYAEQYYNPPGLHPSEPNYLWLEAGTAFGIHDDFDPVRNHQKTANHLTAQLEAAGISWRAYAEGISGKDCPLVSFGVYAAKHNPFVFFDDVTENNLRSSRNCIEHIRPYAELENGTVARYNFITPDECHDMHSVAGCKSGSRIANGDAWLSEQIPKILASSAYQNGGVLIITWDEAIVGDGPIGMIVLSPDAKGNGYHNDIHYTHSSTLRTLQELFGVQPLLGDAANAIDLSDLFRTFP